jgi:chromosome segregation ATPase
VESEARAARLAKEVEETRNERQRLTTQLRRADDKARQDIESLKHHLYDAQRKIDRIVEEAKRDMLKLEADRDRRAGEVRDLKRELLEVRKFAIGPEEADQLRAAAANAQQLQYGLVWFGQGVQPGVLGTLY